MEKVTGIKSVDFKVTAFGYGVVNWNGPTPIAGDDNKELNNHTMPKLRGFNNLTGKIKEGTDYKYKKQATDIDFKKTPLYISQNCIRHHLFKEQSFDLHFASDKNIQKVLSSLTGLVRGYVVPQGNQCKRTSALLLEDFVDQLGNGNFEQLSNASSIEKIEDENGSITYKRGDNSIFSKTTFGDTKYISYGSISVEQLQFISLDKKFDRAAMVIKVGQGKQVADEIEQFLKSLNSTLKPEAIYHSNYVRRGTIFEEGEAGILLNHDAVKILIDATLEKLKNLTIRQAKGYMYVDQIEVDYNDSDKMMRIKRYPDQVNPALNNEFATYFYAK